MRPHEQRQLLWFESIDSAFEQHAAGTGKAVNRDTILLQQKDLVDVGGNDRLLAEAQFQQQRHEGLVQLA